MIDFSALAKTKLLEVAILLGVIAIFALLLATVINGRAFKGNFGNTEFGIHAIYQDIEKVDAKILAVETSFNDKLEKYSHLLAFHVLWDKDKILSHTDSFTVYGNELEKLTGAVAVTIWLLDQPLAASTAGRTVLYTTKGSTAPIIGAKASRGWNDNSWRALAVTTSKTVGVINGIPNLDVGNFKGLYSDTGFEVFNASPMLDTVDKKRALNWNDIGNMVTYTSGKVGIQSVIIVSIDYKVNTEEEAKKAMVSTLTHVPKVARAIVAKLIELNPDVVKLDYLYRL